jgi:hypothetical protein
MQLDRPTLAAAIVALGLTLGGLFVGTGFARGRVADRYVEVKGVAEQEVKADVALWPLRLVTAGNDLADVQARLGRHTAQVYAFLRRHGVDTTQSEIQSVEVTDAYANIYGGERPPAARYVASQTVMVRTTAVDVVLAASQRVGELISSGVVLSSSRMGYGPGGPTFLFTTLNELKPAMIREATASAREAAAQFATDSRSRLGGIRHASQGVFVILPRDQAPGVSEESQPFKTVRVVTTVQYYLKG